jgi:raffinose/stachyose/melibiose transport system substrate-binding protein
MNTEFVDILKKLIAEQGKEALLNPVKCKAFLADYTHGDYKKESRLLLQSLDAGVQKAIDTTDELEICKKQQIRILHEEHFLTAEAASDVVDTLALVLRGDTTKTQPLPQTKLQSNPSSIVKADTSKTVPLKKKKHTKRNLIIGGVVLLFLFFIIHLVQRLNLTIAGSNSKELRVLNYTDMTYSFTIADQNWIWDTFRANNPDVTLIVENLYNEPFHNKTEAYAASGNLPDVLYVWPSGRSISLHQHRLLKDLSPLIEKDGLRLVFNPVVMDTSQQAANYQAMIPLTMTSSHVFYINMEVLNACGLKPAKTYAELKAQVPVLAAKGYQTVIMCAGEIWVNQSCFFSMVAGRFGGEGWHEKILNGQAKFTDPDFVNALAFVKRMYDDKVFAPSVIGMTYGDGPGAFATNKGAYYIDGDWRTGAFITDYITGQALIPVNRQKNFQISIFPEISGTKLSRSTSVVLGTGWAMSASIQSGSPKEDAAWRLIKWLTGKEVQARQIQDATFLAGSRTDIDTSALKLEPIQITAATLPQHYDVATAVFDAVFDSEVANVMNDVLMEIGLGSKTPQQAAVAVQKAFDTWKKQ